MKQLAIRSTGPVSKAVSTPLSAWPEGWPAAVDAFARDLARCGYSAITIRDYRVDVMQLGALVGVPLAEVGERQLRLADAWLVQEGCSPAGRRRRLSAYRRFLEWRDGRQATPGIGPEVLGAARRERPRDRLLLGLVYLAGLRLSELASLEGRDVRRASRRLLSRGGHRWIPLHPFLAEVVEDLRAVESCPPYGPLLRGPQGYALNARSLHARFRKLVEGLGFPGVRPEDLRREAGAFLVNDGAPVGLVQAFLGRDRGRLLSPRIRGLVDLECLRSRVVRIPVGEESGCQAPDSSLL